MGIEDRPVRVPAAQRLDQVVGGVVHGLVRLALGKELDQECAEGIEGRQGSPVSHDLGGATADQIDLERTKVLGKPGVPVQRKLGAGLQSRGGGLGGATAHETAVTAVIDRHRLDYSARLAVAAHPKQDAFVAPLHAQDS